jgi:hypothetical protein
MKNIACKLLLFLAFCLLFSSSMTAQQNSTMNAESLIERQAHFYSDLEARENSNRGILRHTFGSIRIQALQDSAGQGRKFMFLPLFDDAQFQASLKKFIRREESDFTWLGTIPRSRFSLVVITYKEGVLQGVIAADGHVFEIHQASGNIYVIREADQRARTQELHPKSGRKQSLRTLQNNSSSQSGALSTIDIMVVYTAARSTPGIASEIQNAVDTVNQIFITSQVNAQLNLVYTGQTSITESGNINTDLSHLSNNSQIAALRNQYGADLVSMWEKGADASGIGQELGPFSVVAEQGPTAAYTFAHEVGHCMAMNHDVYVTPQADPYPYSHGLVHLEFIDIVCSGGWYTLMAYSNKCDDQGVFCCQIPYFSNPNVNYSGDPTGIVDQADNHRAANNVASTVAGWKNPPACNAVAVPQLSSPADGATNISSAPSLVWTAAANATSYFLEVATDSTFNSVVRSQTLNTTSWDVSPALSAGTTYTWHVSASNNCFTSSFSSSRTFTTQSSCSVPGVPSLSTPTNGAGSVSLSPILDWAAAANATSYEVQISTDSAFNAIVRNAIVTATQWTTSPSLTAGKYYWRVKGRNSCGAGSYSAVFNFTTACGKSTQLLLNPGFESGRVSWVSSPTNIITNTVAYPANTGKWKAQLNGKGFSNTARTYQQVKIPANACSSSVTFYLRVSSSETTTISANDKLRTQILSSTGALLRTLSTVSNLNKSATYIKKTYDLSSYKGKTIRIRFYGTENATKKTTFLIDDTALVVKQ